MDNLHENEHALSTPELIGDDIEKINCIQYWSEIVGLLRSLNVTVVSFKNKVNIIQAIMNELQTIDTELRNDASYPVQTQDGAVEMDQVPKDDEKVLDLSKPQKVELTTIQLAQASKIQRDNLERLQRAAGITSQKTNP